ncbi:MAG: hypothetical protein AABY22_16725 [Nanoarchaeota archaeon]
MWKAKTIELKKNSDSYHYTEYFFDSYSLYINGTIIWQNVTGQYYPNTDSFQTLVCTYCGIEECNSGNMLSMRRKGSSLLFIPCFDLMDTFLERDGCDENEDYGEAYCPPRKWYENGILELDEKMIIQFHYALRVFDIEDVLFISDSEIKKVKEWERMVKQKPKKGFMRNNKH